MPTDADRLEIDLYFRWATSGRVLYRDVSVVPEEAPAPRKVKLAAVNYMPSGATTWEENLAQFGPYLDEAGKQGADVVCLGEMIDSVGTGKSNLEVASPLHGRLDRKGHREIEKILGQAVAVNEDAGFVKKRQIHDAVFEIIERDGVDRGLEVYDQLFRLGFAVSRRSGASLHPFMGANIQRPALPQAEEAELWDAYRQELLASVQEHVDVEDSDFGPVWLACVSGARGSHDQLAWYLGGHGACVDARGQLVPMRRGLVEGKSPREFFAQIPLALGGLAQAILRHQEGLGETPGGAAADGFHVLARGRRAKRPGLVFPRAVESDHEQEPLKDADSRLFVGLPVAD